MRDKDIQERTLRFAIRIVKFVDKFPRTYAAEVIGKQLVEAGTSVGANMEEADGAISKREFISKVSISFKEVKETRFWLRVIKGAELIHNEMNKAELEWLLNEATELASILASILKSSRTK